MGAEGKMSVTSVENPSNIETKGTWRKRNREKNMKYHLNEFKPLINQLSRVWDGNAIDKDDPNFTNDVRENLETIGSRVQV